MFEWFSRFGKRRFAGGGNDKKIDHCIVGLGNPGLKYFNTRHNSGFLVIDKLAEFFKIKDITREDILQAAPAIYEGKNVLLVKPLTYMNASGKAVKLLATRYEIPLDKFLIIYDDVNLEFGTIRIRPGGSDGGQNGIASVIYEMQTEEIPRLRIGIKNQQELDELKDTGDEIDLAEFVLSPFTEDELKNLDVVINEAKEAVLSYLSNGITASMNKFNRNILL